MRRSRNKKSILYSDENKQILVKLVNEIGYGKWSLIADALLLYGIECKTPQSMPAILKQLKNEEIDRSHRICPQLFDIAIRNCFKVPKINLEYKQLTGNTLDKVDLKSKLKKFFKRGIKDLICLFVRRKKHYSAFFSKYYSQRAIKYIIKFSEKDYPDQFMNQISQSCKQLVQFYKSYLQYISQAREYQYEYYKDIFTKKTATQIVDHYAYIAILTQVQQGQNNLEEFMEISPYIEDSIEKIKQQRLYKVMVEVRSYSNLFKQYHEALNNYLDQSEFSINLSGTKPTVTDLKKLEKDYSKQKQQSGILTNTGALRRKDKQIRPSAYEKRFTNDLMREYLNAQNNDDNFEQVDVNYVMQEQKLKNDPELMKHVLENYKFK